MLYHASDVRVEGNLVPAFVHLLIVLAIGSVWIQPSRARPTMHWRFCTALDGLEESYARRIRVSPKGNAWITHGEMDYMSRLDGYAVANPISPGAFLPVYETSFGQIWSLYWKGYWDGFALLREEKWNRYPIEEIRSSIEQIYAMVDELNLYEYCLSFFPAGEDRVWFLLPDRLMEFNLEIRKTTVLKHSRDMTVGRLLDMSPSKEGGVWIGGHSGLARVMETTDDVVLSLRVKEHLADEGLGITDLHWLIEGNDGEVFAVAKSADTGKKALVLFDGSQWRILYATPSENVLAGWRGEDNSLWIYTERSLRKIPEQDYVNDQAFLVEKEGVLSAGLHDVAVEPKGIFWLATSQGVARYAPPLWRTPPTARNVDSTVHTVYEDPEGRIWFACTYSLVLFDHGEWRIYPFREGMKSRFFETESLCSLADGRIVISEYGSSLCIFNHATETFDFVDPPVGDTIQLVSPRGDGTAWVQTLHGADLGDYSLTIHDGKIYQTFLDKGREWELGELRCIVEDSAGNIWLGGTADKGLAVYSDGIYRTFGAEDGYEGGDVFSILERGDGKIWVGGRDHIYEHDGENWSEVQYGLASFDSVRSMISTSDGTVWVASGTGLHRFRDGTWLTNTKEDGLPSSILYEFFQDSTGRIWAGTTQGFSLYHPDADRDPPRTRIPGDKNVAEVAPGDEAQFVFSGVDKWKYTKGERLLYSRRVDDAAWSPFTLDTVATFADLSPGSHRFEARAMDRNWNIDPAATSFEFAVLLPWYKEPGFLVVTALGVILTLLFAGYAINRHIRLRSTYETLRRTQKQLVQSEKMASLGQLVAGVAHEINNPINYIKSNIQPLKEYFAGLKTLAVAVFEEKENMPERMRKRLETIREENELDYTIEDSDKLVAAFEDGSNRIAGIVADLRQYTRVDKDYFARYSLHDAIDASLRLLHHRYETHVTVHKEYGEIPQIVCSPGQMNQVFLNLLSNAEEAIEEEGNVWIRTYHKKGRVIVEIRDDGEGISPEQLWKVFDPFFTTKPVGKGTGLGLSITYGIVEQHGGTITVESEKGKGATFTVSIPVDRETTG